MYKDIREAGGTATKLVLNWNLAEPSLGSYNFAQLDADLAEAEKQGLAVTILIVGTPDWAKEGGLPPYKALPKREFTSAYTNFLLQAARRYPQIVRYEFWNEQNGCGSSTGGCGNSDDSVREYAYWLDVTYSALKQANQSIQVSVGGLDRMDDRFVERLHASPGGRSYNVFSIHPYNWHGALDLDSVKHLHQIVQKPIWITEYGWNIGQGAETSISETQGLQFFSDSMTRLLSDEFSFVTAAYFHTLADFSSDPAMGLIDSSGRKRLWYERFKQFATQNCPQPTPTPIPTAPPRTPTPTPSSTPTPTPISQPGDSDSNGTVDIFDYNLSVTQYSENFCSTTQSGECRQMLQNLTLVVQNFGKSR